MACIQSKNLEDKINDQILGINAGCASWWIGEISQASWLTDLSS
jgi:hypothetical protein